MDPALPQVGDVLEGKYRLVRMIGQGGMGAIYEASHEAIGKRVAIKVLRPGLVADDEARKRFEQEPRAAAATGHPSIIDVYDIGSTAGGGRFLVMELLEGESLGELLDRRGRVEPVLAAYLSAQILSALEAAHGKGIVHRDLKPDNVFLVRSGQALPDVKLLDFGTSIIVEGGAAASRLTQSGGVVGTPYYMAPEQIQAIRDVDRRVDIYAMGVILYESLTGRVPFVGSNVFSVVNAIMTAPLVPPREHNGEIPGGLEAVILKAMARDRAARYRDAVAMLEALLPFLDELTLARVDLPAGLCRPVSAQDGEREPGARGAAGPGPRTVARPGRIALEPSADLDPTTGPARPRRGAAHAVAAALLAASLAALAWLLLGPGPARVGPAAPAGAPETGAAAPAPLAADGSVGSEDADQGLVAVSPADLGALGDAEGARPAESGSPRSGRQDAGRGAPPAGAGRIVGRPSWRDPPAPEPARADAGRGAPPAGAPPLVPFERAFE